MFGHFSTLYMNGVSVSGIIEYDYFFEMFVFCLLSESRKFYDKIVVICHPLCHNIEM